MGYIPVNKRLENIYQKMQNPPKGVMLEVRLLIRYASSKNMLIRVQQSED